MSVENSNDSIGDQTHDLPACIAMLAAQRTNCGPMVSAKLSQPGNEILNILPMHRTE
jgi:hypothetical protein